MRPWPGGLRRTGWVGGLALLLQGCGHSCNDMGCQPGVTLELSSPFEEPGEYRFEVAVGDQVKGCTAFIPLQRDGSEPHCDEGLSVQRVEITTTSGDAVSGHSGDSIVSVWIEGEHQSIAMTIARDGVQRLAAQVAPEYEDVEINGPGCGGCPMATHTVEE